MEIALPGCPIERLFKVGIDAARVLDGQEGCKDRALAPGMGPQSNVAGIVADLPAGAAREGMRSLLTSHPKLLTPAFARRMWLVMFSVAGLTVVAYVVTTQRLLEASARSSLSDEAS